MHESILLDALPDGRGIRIGFHWHRDRFAHTIGALDGDRLDPFLASREGSPEDGWPVSPPFQEVHVEQHDGKPVALLVGRAGRSHWSASIEVDADAAALHFDVACRLKELPCRMSAKDERAPTARSVYQAWVVPTCDSQGTIRVATERAVFEIATTAVDDATEPAKLARDGSGFQIWIPPSMHEEPSTLRWRYTISRST